MCKSLSFSLLFFPCLRVMQVQNDHVSYTSCIFYPYLVIFWLHVLFHNIWISFIFNCVCIVTSSFKAWIASTCLVIASSISAIIKAEAIVKSLPNFSQDFCVGLKFVPNIKRSTRMFSSNMQSYSHCFISYLSLFKKVCANSLASWWHCSSLCQKTWKFNLGFIKALNAHILFFLFLKDKCLAYFLALVLCSN